MWWLYLALTPAAYVFGSIPVGLLVGRLVRGVDIREFGSGKTGFTNSLRTLGLAPSAIVFAGDVAKGALPVLLSRLLHGGAGLEVAGAVAAVLGHIWPIFAGFRGGRGVATSFGATAAMMPQLGVFLLLFGAAIVLAYRYVSLMSVVGTPTGAALVWLLVATGREPIAYGIWGTVASAIILVAHRENIRRLREGTEPRIGQGGRRRPHAGNANP